MANKVVWRPSSSSKPKTTTVTTPKTSGCNSCK